MASTGRASAGVGAAGGPTTSCRVVARFRPLTAREAGARCVAFDAAAEAQVSVTAGGAEASCVPFAFDAVLRESATQSDVYDTVARQTVERVQQGFNGAILAFGQSGSGKTFTMGSAPSTTPAARGLIPRIAAQLLADGADVLTLSLVEVYKERIRDLLCPSRDNLQLHEGPRGTFVGNATEVRVETETEVSFWLGEAVSNRAVNATQLNAESSRSHLILTLALERGGRAAKLLLVDLAGSEKVKNTGATGEALEEAKSINRSLSALGNVIAALTAEGAPPGAVVPFRDSKLTRLLRECLTGAAFTTLVVCASPSARDGAETLSSLRFGSRAKRLPCAPAANAAAEADTPAARAQRLTALEARLAEREAELEALRKELAAAVCVRSGTQPAVPADAWQLPTLVLTWCLAVAAATARDPGGLLSLLPA